jgi:hypothetical protein
MTAYAATMAYRCPCGATTHIFMECDEGPATVVLDCWLCGNALALVVATRLWSAATANGACRLRLIGWEAGHRLWPQNPADQVSQVWRVV